MVSFDAGRAAVTVGQNEGGGLSLGKSETTGDAAVVQRQRYVGSQGQGLTAAAGLNRPAAGKAMQRAKVGKSASVVVPGLEVAAQFNFSSVAGYYPVDFVRGIGRRVRIELVIGGDRHEISDGDFTGCGDESGLQNVSVRKVTLPMAQAGGDRTYPEVSPDIRVEKGGEDAGGVEAGKATPVHRAVGSDQRRRGHIPYQTVVVHIECKPKCRMGESESIIALPRRATSHTHPVIPYLAEESQRRVEARFARSRGGRLPGTAGLVLTLQGRERPLSFHVWKGQLLWLSDFPLKFFRYRCYLC